MKNNEWDYRSENLNTQYILEKNIKIWNAVGKKVCDYYTNNGNPITFTDYTEKHLRTNHLILILDESGKLSIPILNLIHFIGSMAGRKWDDLKAAVYNTFKLILDKPMLKDSIKITVINYDENARIVFKKKTPNLELLNQINIKGGCTNFEVPLALAYDNILESKNEFDIFTIGFLTDGDAAFPTNIVNRINADVDKIKSRIYFTCVLFENENLNEFNEFNEFNRTNLEKIAHDVGGIFSRVINFEELNESFREIINTSLKN